MQNFTKSDVKTGDWVELRNGIRYQTMINDEFKVFVDESGYMPFSCYMEDLTNGGCWDVVRVIRPIEVYQFRYSYWGEGMLMFERKEPTEMTIRRIEEKLGITNLKIVEE